jgi:hypothetical protein
MKPALTATVILLLGLFAGLVVWTSVQGVEVECEVCLEFAGEEVCRRGRGASEDEALRAAQESTCGGNVSGMAELIECRNRQPLRSACTVP